MPKDRVASSSARIFALWITVPAIIMVIISLIFLKNQTRPITALAKAAEKFEFKRDVGFLTYAHYWIDQSIRSYVMDNRSIVRLGTTEDGRKIFGSISKNKTRTVITVIGVLWGIFIYIALSGAAKGLDNGFEKAI